MHISSTEMHLKTTHKQGFTQIWKVTLPCADNESVKHIERNHQNCENMLRIATTDFLRNQKAVLAVLAVLKQQQAQNEVWRNSHKTN